MEMYIDIYYIDNYLSIMAKTKNELIITSGSEIAIIGGGPAGSLFAIFACEYASKRGIDVNVTIYSNRRFSDAGPVGCKGCVGVVNERLNEKLKQAHIVMPEELIKWRSFYKTEYERELEAEAIAKGLDSPRRIGVRFRRI